MPYVPYRFLTAGQKARLGGNRRPRRRFYEDRISRERRLKMNRYRGSNGFSGFSSGRRRTRRSNVSYYR